jgi:hypothetical protein
LEPDLVVEYQRRQKSLWDYFSQIGISPISPASLIIETAISSMMLFYAAATNPSKAAETKWCIFPFCLTRPA